MGPIYRSVVQFAHDREVPPAEVLGGKKRLVLRVLKNLETGDCHFEGSDMIIVTDKASGMNVPIRVDFEIPVATDENGSGYQRAFADWENALDEKRKAVQSQLDSAVLAAPAPPLPKNKSPFEQPLG